MARRIVLTMLALVGALLVTAVIPLGLLTTARERSTFREETLLSAQAFAAVAEDGLTNHTGGQAMASFLARGSLAGGAGWVYNTAGRLVVHVRRPVTTTDGDDTSGTNLWVPAGMVAAALRHGGTIVTEVQDQLRVATTVYDGRTPVGVVVLARSTAELEERLRVLWAGLAAIAAAGLLAGVLVAIGFARWVGRPLSALDAAATMPAGTHRFVPLVSSLSVVVTGLRTCATSRPAVLYTQPASPDRLPLLRNDAVAWLPICLVRPSSARAANARADSSVSSRNVPRSRAVVSRPSGTTAVTRSAPTRASMVNTIRRAITPRRDGNPCRTPFR